MNVSVDVAETVRAAIEELEAVFPLAAEPLDNGGALVTVRQLAIGDKWSVSAIDLVFEVPFNYPFAPIYPYYTDTQLGRVDGVPHPQALQYVQWRGGNWTQISLRKNRWSPQVDTALSAVLQVQHWFEIA